MIATAGMDGIIEQRCTIAIQGNAPDQSIQGAAQNVQGAGSGTLGKPDQIIQLQQGLFPPAGIGRIAIDHRFRRIYRRAILILPDGTAGAVESTSGIDFPDRGMSMEQRVQLCRIGCRDAQSILG